MKHDVSVAVLLVLPAARVKKMIGAVLILHCSISIEH